MSSLVLEQPKPSALASLARRFVTEVLIPLLVGLGIGAGALAPCGKGACGESSPPAVTSHP